VSERVRRCSSIDSKTDSFLTTAGGGSNVTLAADTREAARAHPFLHDALRAGVVNYTAAARFLGVGGDVEAGATALRRYAESLEEDASEDRNRPATVTMQRGTGVAQAGEEAVLTVGDAGLVPGEGSLTVVLATGTVDATTLERVLGRFRIADVTVEAAGLTDGSLSVAVPDRRAATAVRLVEDCV
jgi:hypothetical protein